MPAMIVDPRRVKSFKNADAFEKWLKAHHETEPEIWLKVHKKGSGLVSVTTAEALDICLCFGWIDAIRKSFDDQSFLQRYTPRGKKSTWSQVNREHVARLAAAGRMTVHGQRQIDAAKADGRWDAAYAPIRATTHATIPDDLRAAIEASPRAKKTFAKLDKMNIFSLAFRVNALKTAAGREKRIAAFVQMLARGETILPIRTPRPKKA